MSKRAVTTSVSFAALLALSLTLGWASCSGGAPDRQLSDAGRRGESTFAAFCATCHNYADPFKDGIQGPGIARSSRELLTNKVLHGKYPDGYEPKRPGAISMAPLPQVKDRIGDLYAFLQEVPDPDAKPEQGKPN